MSDALKPVVVVGVGALGSHVAMFARNWKEPLRLIDFDRVEGKNILAQVHSKLGQGQNKARALSQLLAGLWGTSVEAIPHKLSSDNVAPLLGDAALVLDCVDNIEARLLIQRFVRAREIPCLHGALSADARFGRIVWDDAFVPDAEGAQGAPTCVAGEGLPFFGMMGGWLAGTARAFLDAGARSSYQLTPTNIVCLGRS